MSDAIVTALIMAAGSIICQILINRGNRTKRTKEETEKSKQTAINEAVKEQQLKTKLARIEEKLEIHNNYAEKLAEIATDIAVIKNDIKTLYKEAKAS